MQRINAIPLDTTDEAPAALFAAIKQQLGSVPNIFRTMAQAPAALEAFLAFNGTLAKGRLTAAERELVALAAAGTNQCDYCASAHTALGGMAGLGKPEMASVIAGEALEGRNGALVSLVRKIVDNRGVLADADLNDAALAGLDDGLIVEIIANTAANILTNYFNHIAATEIDFPLVETRTSEAA